jgi:hypothetical protein
MKSDQETLEILKQLKGQTCGHLSEHAYEMVKKCISVAQPKEILEIGFHVGHSSVLWLALSEANVTSCDVGGHWVTKEYLDKSVVIINENFPQRFRFFLESSNTFPFRQKVLDRQYDFMFIDGLHEEHACRFDIETALAGRIPYILIDDYSWNKGELIPMFQRFHQLELLETFVYHNYDLRLPGGLCQNDAALFKVKYG